MLLATLKFVTGCVNVPIMGFTPKPSISFSHVSAREENQLIDSTRLRRQELREAAAVGGERYTSIPARRRLLMRANTCGNVLIIPVDNCSHQRFKNFYEDFVESVMGAGNAFGFA